MTKWITRLNATDKSSQYGAIQLVTETVVNTAKTLGYQEINLTGYENINNNTPRREHLIDALLGVVQDGDTVIVQFPMWTHLNFQAEFFQYIKSIKNSKMVALIHDIPTWMFTEGNDYDRENDFWLNKLKEFDLIIVGNERMGQKLREDGVEVAMISMHIWDYLYSGPVKEKKYKKEIYYAGGRNIEAVDYEGDTRLKIYNHWASEAVTSKPNVEWLGRVSSYEILSQIDGGFGLVASENIKEKSNMNFEYYNQFNNPTKLSFYIAGGLPVIIPNKMAHAEWIKERGIGLIVDDLNELDKVLAEVTTEQYNEMLAAIEPWQKAVSEGFFVKRALLAMTRYLDLGFTDILVK